MKTWIVFCLLLCGAAVLDAADWPGILGPTRNGQAADTEVAPRAEQINDRLQPLWRRPAGSGYAGAAIAGTPPVAYLFERTTDRETLTAVALSDGAKELWSSAAPVRYVSSIAEDNGPRCTPIVTENRVYTYGVTGRLCAYDRATGAVIWERQAAADFKAPEGYFGCGSTPLVLGERVIVNVGGPRGAAIAAFNAADGKTVWQLGDDTASYSTPIATSENNQSRVAVVTRLNCFWLDPTTGTELSRVPFGARGPTVNAAAPLRLGKRLFLTASYGVGATWLDTAGDRLQPVWSDDELLSSQYTTPIALDERTLIGLHGRQDVGVAELRCVDLQQRKILWQRADFGAGHLIRIKETIVVIKTTGEIVLFAAAGDAYRELAATRLKTTTVQALPAWADGKLLLRDTTAWYCLDLSGGQP